MGGTYRVEWYSRSMRGRLTRMTPDTIIRMLSNADIGAVVMSIDQTVLFWNRKAERLLGYRPAHVIGRRCYEAPGGPFGEGLTSECAHGCPTMRLMRSGRIPHSVGMALRTASGQQRMMNLTPMVVATEDADTPLLVHLIDDGATVTESQRMVDAARKGLVQTGHTVISDLSIDEAEREQLRPLSPRELQVLQLVADGRDTESIAEELEISLHTVRNHIRNLRRKLNARTKLEAVVTGMRIGLLGRQ